MDYKDQVSNLTYFILPDDETGFLDRLDDLNQGLSLVRSAIAHPSTFPKVPELERSDLDILICCRRLAWGESVDMDLRHYLFCKRHAEGLIDIVLIFRL